MTHSVTPNSADIDENCATSGDSLQCEIYAWLKYFDTKVIEEEVKVLNWIAIDGLKQFFIRLTMCQIWISNF
jgi:hypothetical protein